MENQLAFESGKGAMSINPRGGGPGYMWQRDLVHCLPMVMRNAVILTQAFLLKQNDPELQERLVVLDTLAQFYLRLYAEGRKDQTAALKNIEELHVYIQSLPSDQQSIVAVFHILMVNCLFAHLFAVKELMIATPETLDSSAYNFEIFLAMWSQVAAPMRESLFGSARMAGVLNNRIDLSSLLQPAVNLMSQIKENQNARLAQTSPPASG